MYRSNNSNVAGNSGGRCNNVAGTGRICNNVAGDFGGRCNNVAGTGGNCNNVAGTGGNCNNVAGTGGSGCFVCCPRNRVAAEIALRGPGCISGTGRCGEFTASFVENDGRFARGYGIVEGVFNECGGQVSPAGNVQNQLGRSRKCHCNNWCGNLKTPTTVPR